MGYLTSWNTCFLKISIGALKSELDSPTKIGPVSHVLNDAQKTVVSYLENKKWKGNDIYTRKRERKKERDKDQVRKKLNKIPVKKNNTEGVSEKKTYKSNLENKMIKTVR